MTNDLSALPQHVREAAVFLAHPFDPTMLGSPLKGASQSLDAVRTITAELLRVYGENAELRAHIEENYLDVGGVLSEWKKEKARAKRAESELAALRKRVAEAPVGTYEAGLADHGIVNTHRWASRAMIGKRVALLTVIDEDKA